MKALTFTTKFNVGQKVYISGLTETIENASCPDCFDARVWTVTAPNGQVYDIACPRCNYSHTLSTLRVPSLRVVKYAPTVVTATILSTEIFLQKKSKRVSYRATYIDSNGKEHSVHIDETRPITKLHKIHDAAMQFATKLSEEHNKRENETTRPATKLPIKILSDINLAEELRRLKLRDYQLTAALTSLSKHRLSKLQRSIVNGSLRVHEKEPADAQLPSPEPEASLKSEAN